MNSGFQFMKSLSKAKKAELFDQIAENYYDANFGTFSKSQMDLLMFSQYLDALIDAERKFDDYTVSKQLGIVQSSVRQLKKKKQLIYPKDYKWYKAFLEYSQNATFDNFGRIVISIPDPNVYIELQQAIEELGGYVEVQLNSKLLKIPPGYYIKLLLKIYELDSGENEKEIEKFKKEFIRRLNKKYREAEKLAEDLTEKSIGTKLKTAGLEIGIDILKDMIPGGNILLQGIGEIGKRLFDK